MTSSASVKPSTLRIPCVYPITDRRLAGGIPHAAIVEMLCRGGATLIQMREKSPIPDRQLLADARAAVLAARSAGARLILNDRCDVAALCGADGVHLGGEDLPPGASRGMLGPGALIGRSTHTVEEAIAEAAGPVDYVALGPIFATPNASVERAPLGLESVARAAASIAIPLVAIGGIDLLRARDVLAAGAASVAVIGDLMSAADIPSRVAAYLALKS